MNDNRHKVSTAFFCLLIVLSSRSQLYIFDSKVSTMKNYSLNILIYLAKILLED